MGRVEIISGRERRRSPSIEEKLSILSEGLAPGMSMAAVGRRHDYDPQQLSKWRKELTEAGLIAEATPDQPSFPPVELAQPEPRPRRSTRGRPPGRSKLVEVTLANGWTLRVAQDIDPEMLRRVVRALEEGTDLLSRRALAPCARSLALRGEAVFLIDDNRRTPCADWDLRTRDGEPRAYQVSISEAGGGTSRTALAAEVLHVRVGADPVTPWSGQAPLCRANITAGLLHALEDALRETFETAPLGSQIVPFPEAPGTDMEALGRGFRGQRGRVLLRESVATTAAGGPVPQTDWRPADTSPDLSRSMTAETLSAARNAILAAFGVLPGIVNPSTTGPLVKEAQRHLAQWQLQPIAALIAEEASAKLGSTVTLDVMRPLQAYDAGGRARALSGIVTALATAKEAGLDPAGVAKAFGQVGWEKE